MEKLGQLDATNIAASKARNNEPPGDVGIEEECIPSILKQYTAWDVYNDEARNVDDALMKDWRDSLNSLLLFAAVFAAVLSAFIIESKKMLEQDPTDLLVNATIFSVLNRGNLSVKYIPPEFEATAAAVSINCCLFASLGISVFAALVSIIALQWVVDYDAAVTRGGPSSEDRAKSRQFRYAGVVRWKMGEIIALLPLLLHSSVVLFWAGLAQWIWTIHPTVGGVVIAGAAIGAFLYVSITLIASIWASAPFRTPLSQGVYWLFKPSISLIHKLLLMTPLRHIPQWLTSLSHISSSVTKPSPKPGVIGRRVVGIARWLKKNLVPDDTASQREQRVTVRDLSLREHALCWLAQQLPISVASHRQLLLLLSEIPSRASLSPRFFKAPWWWILDFLGQHYLSKTLDGTLSKDDQKEVDILLQWGEIGDKLRRVGEYGHKTSALGRKNFEPTPGKPVVNAALLLKKDAPKTLLRLIAESPYLRVSSDAAKALSIWAKHVEPHDVIRANIPALVKLLENDDPRTRSAAAAALGYLSDHAELQDEIHLGVPSLIKQLEDSDPGVRTAAASAIEKLVKHVEFCDTLSANVPSLFELLKNPGWSIRRIAADVLNKLAMHAELHDALEAKVPFLVGLFEDHERDTRSIAAKLLNNLAKYAELRDGIRLEIPRFIKLLKDPKPGIRADAASILGELAQYAEYDDAIHPGIPQLIHLFKDEDKTARLNAVTALGNVAEHEGLRDIIGPEIPRFIKLLIDPGKYVRVAAVSTLGNLAQCAELCDSIIAVIPQLIELLRDQDPLARLGATFALGKLSQHAAFRDEDEMGVGVGIIIELLNDKDENVRSAAVSTIGNWPDLANLPTAIPPLIEWLKHLKSDDGTAAASALVNLAKHEGFRNLILAVFPLITERLHEQGPFVRSDVCSIIANLAEHREFRGAILDAIPLLIEQLDDPHWSPQCGAASALGNLAKHKELREAICAAVPSLIKLLNDQTGLVRVDAAQALNKLADHAELYDSICVAISSLIEELKVEDPARRSLAAAALGYLRQNAELWDGIRTAVPLLVKLAKDHNSKFQAAAEDILSALLAEHDWSYHGMAHSDI